MNKVIVTGANGFIGKNLIKKLRKLDYEITAVVRNLKKIDEIDGEINYIEMDISKPSNKFMDIAESSDLLIHLAWNGLTDYKSIEHINTELPIHFNFIKSSIKLGIKNICITGTCFEYGIQFGALSESIETKPVTAYGYAKDSLRKQLQYLKNEEVFNLTWLRPFYIYGDDQPDSSLYSQLRIAVEQAKPFFNMSGGEQLRDYLHIDELIDKIINLAILQKDLGIVNVCSGSPISVRNLVEQWIKEKSWNIQLNPGYYEYPSHEPMAFWGDITKFNNIMNLD